jgi:hypothetical protein
MGKEQEPIFTQEEIEELYRALEKPMYNVVYRWLWDPEEARDVVQETFLRLWRAWAGERTVFAKHAMSPSRPTGCSPIRSPSSASTT